MDQLECVNGWPLASGRVEYKTLNQLQFVCVEI